MDFKGFYDEIIFDVDGSTLKSYTGKQGDTKSRGLYVTVTQKNAVIEDLTGLSMRLFYEKPDKTRGFIDGVVDGNKFRIDYTNQMYAVPGVVKAELRLTGPDGEIITAKTFKILVDGSIADRSIVSKNERGILDRAFELAEDIIPRLELLDVELLEDVQAEMLGARHSNTKDETYENLGDRLDAAEQDLLDHKAEYTSNRQQDQLKIAKVEKELNDYKATMQQVNINQEPKQKATGYGVISLPPNAAEGQVSSVGIKGLTATNLIKNGDFRNGLSGWEGYYTHQIKMDTSRYLTGFQSVRFEQEAGTHTDYRLRQDIEVPDGHKVYYRAYIFCESIENSVYVRFRMSDIGGYDNNVEITKQTREDFLLNQWECLSMIREVTPGSGGIRFELTVYSNENAAITLNADGFFAIDLTATFGAGNEPTKEECDKIFANWFDGTKSTVGAIRIKSVGKNLFDKNNAIKGKYISTGGGIGENPSLALSGYIQIMPNTSYAKSNSYGGWWFDSNKVGISYVAGTSISSPSNAKYFMGNIDNDERLDIFQFEKGDTATPYEPYRESNAYVIAKDEEGNILELRSLPNGTKDEVRVSEGKLIKRVSDEVKTWNLTWSRVEGADTNDYYGIRTYDLNSMPSYIRHSVYMSKGEHTTQYTSGYANKNDLVYYDSGHGVDFRFKVPKSAFTNNWTLAETQAWLEQNQVTLTYQLAEPVEIPIQVSGTLTSYPNGTVYIERILPDAGIYTDKITILHQDAPIKRLDRLSKVDFMTGVETELDISRAEISEDKLSFTHPELSAGDIVFFEYEYDVESTDGEAEVEFYDSRYVVKDTETGKFYKWNIVVANGQPSIELVEV